MLFTFALEYTIRSVQVSQDGLKLNGPHQFLAYADDVNILGGNIHTLKENAEALVASTREIGLGVSADKTKYMVYAGRIHSVRTCNSTFERVEKFKYSKIILRKKLRANTSQEMLAIIRCRIFCLPGCYPKI